MAQELELEDFSSHGIREPLTTRIAGILRAYPDSTQIARELLQNSDDARSSVQWYLLDHRDHVKHARATGDNAKLQLFHEDLEEHMGPALLAGSDSVFEDRDFRSLKNLASSEKKSDESKIGQMGIGFNSIYHLTDCPSFISGDQLMVIEPHERIFNGKRSKFREGAVRGNFVTGNQGLKIFPDQLKAFSVLEDIDFTKPYNGTIFRLPLRTPEQAKDSVLTKYSHTPQEVLDMLTELKDEALKALLFLKHVEKILIYERKEDQDKPTKLFEIEIVNATEIRDQRSQLLRDFKNHVQSDGSLGQDAILECSVRPTFRMTHGDGRTTEETWQVTTRVGDLKKTRAAMLLDSNGDANISEHKLIPWAGIAAPVEPGVKIDEAGLFCFLPVGDIQLPFPVHVNGHFAVEQSRRDIWTNTDKKIKVQSSAGIESLWNVHLFDKQIPEAYALFLENIGVDHGANYNLWPLTCGDGIGRDAVWKDMLGKTLRAVLSHDRPVFFCGPDHSGEVTIEPYSKIYFAGRDIDPYPLLKKALHEVVSLAENVPDVILAELPDAVEALGLAPCILTSKMVIAILYDSKSQWTLTADAATRVEMVKYCLQDDMSASLVGLPLLPLTEGTWVEFSREQARERFRVSREVFRVLSVSNKGLVDLDVEGYPFDEIESGCGLALRTGSNSGMYWSNMSPSSVAERIKTVFHDVVYQDGIVPAGRVSRTPDQFPTDAWLTDFWNMAHSLSSSEDQEILLSRLANAPLIPLRRGYLAPLSEGQSVLYLNTDTSRDESLSTALEIMDCRLDCQVLREIPLDSMLRLHGYLVDVSVGSSVLRVLSDVSPSLYQQLSPDDCSHLQRYLTTYLSAEIVLDYLQRQSLRCLPVFKTYEDSRLVPLDTFSESRSKRWKVAQGFCHSSQPWIPASVDLLAEDQPMKHHLHRLLEIPFLDKAEYLHLLVSQLERRSKSEWDPILSELFVGYYEFKKRINVGLLLRNLAFVQVRTRTTSEDTTTQSRSKPGSVVDARLSMFFMDEEAVFPSGIYAQPAFRGPLEELGMMHEFSPAFVEERMSSLFDASSDEPGSSHKKASQAFYDHLNSLFSREFMTPDVLSKIVSLPWIYVGSGDLRCPRECRPKEDQCLVGEQMPLSDFSPSNELLRKSMGWISPPPLGKVLDHFLSLLEQNPTVANQFSNLEDHDVTPIYKYLANKAQDPDILEAIEKRLHGRPWILVSGRLYGVDRVAFKMEYNLTPHFAQLPSSSLDGLYRSLGVRENIHHRDIESILASIASNYKDGVRLSDEDAILVRRLLFALSHQSAGTLSPDLPVLTRDGSLKRAADVVYDDRSARQAGSSENMLTYTFLDSGIPIDVARRLQITMLSLRTLEKSKDVAFESFFQKEDIVDRIRGILHDYDPSGIFNEYLQNASDAGATKFSVILDTRKYDGAKVLSKEMEAWQGPALVFYNDAMFTEEGFAALCKLGVGNKKEDTSKIGRHGLGFNSAYHFTDVPSIVSGNSLVFFDPHMSNLPKSRDAYGNLVAERGHRYNMISLDKEALVDQLQPYRGIFGCDMEYFDGTIFRLPLRVKDMHPVDKPSFGGDGWTVDQVRRMIALWIEDAKIGMLFLKNIRTIALSDGASPKVSVTKRDHSNPRAMRFMAESAPPEPCHVSIVDIVSSPSSIGNGGPSSWLLYVEDSLPEDAPSNIHSLVNDKYLSTQSGVAIPLTGARDSTFKSCRGRLVVHLPTPMETMLPFHLHSGFALTTNRKTLAGNDMSVWNDYLLKTRLPLTVIKAYKQLMRWSFRPSAVGGPMPHDLSAALYLYYKQWPINVHDSFSAFSRAFFQHAYTSLVFPCLGNQPDRPIVNVAGKEVIMMGHCVTKDVKSRVLAWMREGGRYIVETTRDFQSCLKSEWDDETKHRCRQIDCDLIRKRLREDPGFIPRQMKSMTDKRWILETIFKPMTDGSKVEEPLEGLAVVPLLNGEWRPLQSSPVYFIASPEAMELIDGKFILVDTTIFDSVMLKSAKDALLKNPSFGFEELPMSGFAAIFSAENSNGVSEDKRNLLWRYLKKFVDLTSMQDLPIVRTTSGTVVTLAKASGGLDVSTANLPRNTLRITTELLRRLEVVMFDASQHCNHTYFHSLHVGYTEPRFLGLFAKHWPMYASSFVISEEEAEFLRNSIRFSITNLSELVLSSLGDLPIWPTFGPAGSPLRSAKSCMYIKDHGSLDHLGDHHNILREVIGMSTFDKMGATPIQAAIVLRDHIMPKFASDELQCTGTTRGAYLSLCRSLMSTASQNNTYDSVVTKLVLSDSPCFLASDGSFQTLAHVLLPQEELTENIFENEQHRFLNRDLYSILVGRRFKPEIRGVDYPGVVEECAEFVLEEIADGIEDPDEILSRAKFLVRYIYSNPGSTDWMDPKWAIVPRELNPEYPYNQNKPALRRYMSFSTLCFPVDRDYLWTQRGFFPQDLVPPETFQDRYANIGKFSCGECCQHLEVLVNHFAPTLTTTERQLSFKATLFKIYKSFEDRCSENDSERDSVRNLLREFMTVPYILDGDDKDPSKSKSWIWPRNMVIGIDHKNGEHQPAHSSLMKYRKFLVAAGANEWKHVEGQVEVGARRQAGLVEQQITAYFEEQDEKKGFMDVRFVFDGGESILAHKVILASVGEAVVRELTGLWATASRHDPANPAIDIIQKKGDYSAFWGLLYFFYTDDLITTNGRLPTTTQSYSTQDTEDQISQRLQYLMSLQDLAAEYFVDRLKALIAQELMLPGRVMYSNVFTIRKHAEENQDENVINYCNKFIRVRENKTLIKNYFEDEIAAAEIRLQAVENSLGGDDGGEQVEAKKALTNELEDLRAHLQELNRKR
ncbi:hypothetical protein BGW39_009457 [Mortierella sp. 14UC]|nr:hypothetical protein BGW39_009457 [Mortierella sp. 14UC]